MIKKLFNCDICDAQGLISVSTSDVSVEEICHCPVCGSPLLSDDELQEDE